MKNNKYIHWNEYKVLESTANFINKLETFKREYNKLNFYSIIKKLF